MSLEQYEWCERKGIQDLDNLQYLGQDDKYVYFRRPDIGLKISRKKEMIGWIF